MSEPTWGDSDRQELLETRITLAEIKGMLSATLARHDQRLDQHENTLIQHDGRLGEKGKMLARHDERLKDLEEDNQAARAQQDARQSRVLAALSLFVAAVSVAFTILNPA